MFDLLAYLFVNVGLQELAELFAANRPNLSICNAVDDCCDGSGGTVPVREGRRRLRGRQFEVDLWP